MHEQTIIGPAPVPLPAPRDRTVIAPAPRAFSPRAPLVARPRPGERYHWARTPTLVGVHGVGLAIDDGADDITDTFEPPPPIRLLEPPRPAAQPSVLLWLVLAACLLGGAMIAAVALM